MSGILVTGGSGQVATAVVALARARGLDVHHVGRPAFDYVRLDSVAAMFERVAPELVINAAAYTAVDRAELDQDAAWQANHAGPARLAELCAHGGARMLHLSTDYVFDGTKSAPYVEQDPTGPTGVYGASKLAGERAVLANLPDAIVMRTSWVYAPYGKNFLLTMLQAGRRNNHLRVVEDQRGCPTSALDLAEVVLQVAAHRHWQGGVFHAAGAGETSWHGFAEAIFERAAAHGLRPPFVEAVGSASWPTPAQRPANSRLDCTRLRMIFGAVLPPWRGSVDQAVDAVFARERTQPKAIPV